MIKFCILIVLILGAIFTVRAEALTNVTEQVGFDQKINTTLPGNLFFVDETGQRVRLQKFLGNRPVVLALVYYQCPMLCTEVLNGIVRALQPISLNVGEDFEVVTVSIDPRETPQLAAQKKATYLRAYHRRNAAAGWHCLVGDQNAISQLAESVGFRYRFDKATQQYAHAAGFVVLTPSGKISRYFFGIDFSPDELQTSLKTAAQERPGRFVHELLLLCFHYDPSTGKYSFTILKTLRAAGVVTMIFLVGAIVLMLRRDRRKQTSTREVASPVP